MNAPKKREYVLDPDTGEVSTRGPYETKFQTIITPAGFSCGEWSADQLEAAIDLYRTWDPTIVLPEYWKKDEYGDYVHKFTPAWVRKTDGAIVGVEYNSAPNEIIRQACYISDQIKAQLEKEAE